MVAMMGSGEKGWKKGPWTLEEDKLLSEYVSLHGEGRWSSVSKFAGLNRSGKSCRLRWVNYLKPGLKKGQLTPQEEGIIFELHAVLGNKWSTIAKYLPGRTDNEIKNYWRTHFKKKEKSSHNNKKLEKRRAKMLKQMKQGQRPQEYDVRSIPTSSHSETNINETNLSQTQNNNHDIMAIMEDQYGPLPFIDQDFPSLWPDTVEDDGFWITLWNLDETQGHADHVNHFSKHAMQNQGTFGGDSSKLLPMQNQDKASCFDDISNNLCYAKYMFR